MIVQTHGALGDLCRFVHMATAADLVLAVEIASDGQTQPTVSHPHHVRHRFNLRQSGLLDREWVGKPMDAGQFRLPAALIAALGARPGHLLFVPVRLSNEMAGGLLIFWIGAAPKFPIIEQVPLLAEGVAMVLEAERKSARQKHIHDQFHDLFESVPTGIIVMEGGARSALVNEKAADLLGVKAGAQSAEAMAVAMRALREGCVNREALEAEFADVVADIDYSIVTQWDLGERQLEVDTHPIRGDGEHGRIWLFNDITAELRIAHELRLQAESDPLTSAPNRRHFEERATQIMATREARGQSVTVLMIDVDHFKSINDRYGHLVGDQVLRAVARRCREALRAEDMFARFGGEEFIALLETTDIDDVKAIAERLRAVIADAPINVDGIMVDARISIGAAADQDDESIPPSGLHALIARADAALYAAKRGGRDQVVLAA